MKILVWKIRTEKGLTLEELSRLTGISRSTLHNIEKEKNNIMPRIDALEKIAKAMKVRISDLYESKYK